MEQNDYPTLNAEQDVLVICPRFVVEKDPYRCSIMEMTIIKMVIDKKYLCNFDKTLFSQIQ